MMLEEVWAANEFKAVVLLSNVFLRPCQLTLLMFQTSSSLQQVESMVSQRLWAGLPGSFVHSRRVTCSKQGCVTRA